MNLVFLTRPIYQHYLLRHKIINLNLFRPFGLLKCLSLNATPKKEKNGLSTALLYTHLQIRYKSTIEDGFLKRNLKKMKFKLFTTPKLNNQGSLLYTVMDPYIDVQKFFEICKMPDTFFSWFRVKELHVWMLCARCMAAGDDGKIIRNALIESFYLELDQRSKQLENVVSSIRNKDVTDMCHIFQEDLILYDTVLDGDDKKLASVLWTTLFNCTELSNPLHLECCVNYVRRNLAHLDSIPFDTIYIKREISFLPLMEPERISHKLN